MGEADSYFCSISGLISTEIGDKYKGAILQWNNIDSRTNRAVNDSEILKY